MYCTLVSIYLFYMYCILFKNKNLNLIEIELLYQNKEIKIQEIKLLHPNKKCLQNEKNLN